MNDPDKKETELPSFIHSFAHSNSQIVSLFMCMYSIHIYTCMRIRQKSIPSLLYFLCVLFIPLVSVVP